MIMSFTLIKQAQELKKIATLSKIAQQKVKLENHRYTKSLENKIK